MSGSTSRPTHAYVGIQRYCKCVTASALDMFTTSQERANTARMVADMIREGLIVKRVKLIDVKLTECPHQITPKGQGTLPI